MRSRALSFIRVVGSTAALGVLSYFYIRNAPRAFTSAVTGEIVPSWTFNLISVWLVGSFGWIIVLVQGRRERNLLFGTLAAFIFFHQVVITWLVFRRGPFTGYKSTMILEVLGWLLATILLFLGKVKKTTS